MHSTVNSHLIPYSAVENRSFNPDGDALYDQIVVVVKDGELKFLE